MGAILATITVKDTTKKVTIESVGVRFKRNRICAKRGSFYYRSTRWLAAQNAQSVLKIAKGNAKPDSNKVQTDSNPRSLINTLYNS